MLRWIAPFGAAILIIGWNRELEDWQVALSFTAALLVAMLLQATAPKNKDLESNKDNVVSLDEFRRQRHGSSFEENQARLQNVFETQYLHEAEMMASMLESEGIPTHLFNRHNASILIHPMSEMQVKVLVPHDEVEHALALIEHYRNSITPEDSSIA